jgi:hypothetical protein
MMVFFVLPVGVDGALHHIDVKVVLLDGLDEPFQEVEVGHVVVDFILD